MKKIKFIKHEDNLGISENSIFEIMENEEDNKAFFFKDLNTNHMKIQAKLAENFIKRGYAIYENEK